MNHVWAAALCSRSRQARAVELSAYDLAGEPRNPQWHDYGTPGKERRWNGTRYAYRDKPARGGSSAGAGQKKTESAGKKAPVRKTKQKPAPAGGSVEGAVGLYKNARTATDEQIVELAKFLASAPKKDLVAIGDQVGIAGAARLGQKKLAAAITQRVRDRRGASQRVALNHRSRSDQPGIGGRIQDAVEGAAEFVGDGLTGILREILGL